MSALVGLLTLITGAVMVTVALTTPGKQLTLCFFGGALIGCGFALAAGLGS